MGAINALTRQDRSMSGGSYNYLYCWPDDLTQHRTDLEEMTVRLEGLDWAAQAAAASRRVAALLDEAAALAHSLTDAWHAIEWWDSCDWGEDRARKQVEPYRAPDGRRVEDVWYRLVQLGDGVVELRPMRVPGVADD